MNKPLLIRSVSFGIFLGLVLVIADIVSGGNVIKFMVRFSFVIAILLIIAILAASIIIANRPLSLINNGKYEEAVSVLMEKHNKYSKTFGYKGNYAIMAANCLSRLGNFEKSTECLKSIDVNRLDKYTKACYYGVYADNIYFTNGDLKTVCEYLGVVKELIDIPDMLLTEALVEYDCGNESKAKEIIDKYLSSNLNKKILPGFYTFIIIDEFGKTVERNFRLGMYYYKIMEYDKAIKHFTIAAEYNKVDNFFTKRAKEQVKQCQVRG